MIIPKLDLHAHVAFERAYPYIQNGTEWGLTCPDLRAMYDRIGVEKGVALPSISPEFGCDQNTNDDARLCAATYPDTIGWWFCNIDPRWMTNGPDADLSRPMEYYKSLGARGIGELTANLPIDDPRMQNLFYHAEQCDLPILFHMGRSGGGDYGIVDELNLPKLEAALQNFPKLKFIGHSQKWWSEISGDITEARRGARPISRVVPGGRAVELLRDYPNMYGDLSAGSGQNAIRRDPEFGFRFLEEFQDKLFFGIDFCTPSNYFVLSHFLDQAVEGGYISQAAYNKICRENLLQLLEGDPHFPTTTSEVSA